MVLPGQRPRCPRTARSPPPAPHVSAAASAARSRSTSLRPPGSRHAQPRYHWLPWSPMQMSRRGGRVELATARCGHPRLSRLMALLAKVLKRRRPAPSLSSGAAPPSPADAGLLPSLPTNTGVFKRVRGIGFRSEFLRKMGRGSTPQKQLLKTILV